MSGVTPEDYKTIRENLTQIIDAATQQREDAYKQAEKCEPPVTMRPAKKGDIRPGAVIWYPLGLLGRDAKWNIVMKRWEDTKDGYIDHFGKACRIEYGFVEAGE